MYCDFDAVWHPALLSKLSAYCIQDQLHTGIPDFLYSCSQHVALKEILSYPLPVKAEVPQGSLLSLLLIFINDLSVSLENPLYLFADDCTLFHDIPHPSDRQAAASSLSSDLDKITSWSNTWIMSFNPDMSHSPALSPKGLSGIISQDLSSANQISKLASKASLWLAILHHTKFFLGTAKLISTCKAFIHSWMEFYSPLQAGLPASHLAQLDAAETKAFKIIGISHNEAGSMGLSLHCHRQDGGVCLLSPPFWSCSWWSFCALSLPGFCQAHMINNQPVSGKPT